MEAQDYRQDLSHIREMMSRSTRFISLSGLSGILAGIYALIGAGLAYFRIGQIEVYSSDSLKNTLRSFAASIKKVEDLILIALAVLILAVGSAMFLTFKKAKKNKEKIWTSTTRRLLFYFLVPLCSGGLFCLVLISEDLVGLVAPACLLFYGLALLNASKYTFGDIKYLGLIEILLGLTATQFIGFGLLFWAIGFGVCHIIYGIILYNKYDRNPA
ncbi:MAG: hypothetical protein WBG71_12275 [Leeuwenhoekiella sp.]